TSGSPSNDLAGLEITQGHKACARRHEVLERMSTQQVPDRIDPLIGEFEQLGETISHPGRDPIKGARIFGWVKQEQRDHGEPGKELNPKMESQIVGPAPQQQTEQSEC